MKYCPQCGNLVDDNAAYCVSCGCKLGEQTENKEVSEVKEVSNVESSDQSTVQNNAPNTAPSNVPNNVPNTTPSNVPNTTQNNVQNTAPISTPILRTDRSLFTYLLLSTLTLGIYGIIMMSRVSKDINTIASKYDGKKTMNYCWVILVFSWLTFGIVPIVWLHRISARIGNELARRGINYKFGAGTLWGWGILGMFIFVGPFVYQYKLFQAMNLLSADFNRRG